MKYILGFILFLFTSNLFAQTTSEWDVITRTPTGGQGIKLRWMPGTADEWIKGLQNGYTITRVSSTGQSVNLGDIAPVSPGDSSLPKWNAYWKADSVVYKDLFYISIDKNNLEKHILDPSLTPSQRQREVDEERFFFAGILADLKFKAAELVGLGYTDNTVVAGMSYKYTIAIRNTSSSFTTGFISTVSTQLPNIPISFTSETKRLKIGWNTQGLINHYGGYYVEKSTNAGASYIRLNKEPFVNLDTLSTWMFHVDSIPNTTATYRYRVVGISYFDELKYSAHKDTTITKVLEYEPGIRSVGVLGSNFKVNWRYPHNQEAFSLAQANADLTSYSLAVAKSDTARLGQAKFKIVKTGISKSDTTTTVTRTVVDNAIKSIILPNNKNADTTTTFFFYIVANAAAVSAQSAPYGYIP